MCVHRSEDIEVKMTGSLFSVSPIQAGPMKRPVLVKRLRTKNQSDIGAMYCVLILILLPINANRGFLDHGI